MPEEKKSEPKKQYPKAKYSAEKAPVLVASPEEEKELGAGWFDHPDQAKAKPEEVKPEAKPQPKQEDKPQQEKKL